jgi:predicted dehydrogenase
MENRRIGIGIIGVGGWGDMHAQTYDYDDRVVLAALCDTDSDRLSQAMSKYNVDRGYSDYRELLQNDGVGAVSIVTPDFSHTEIALAAIEAGKDVLIEKPLATTVDECEKIADAAEAAGVKFMVDFHNRWNPIFYKTKESILKGQLGSPSYIYLRLNDEITVPTEWLKWAGRSSVAWFIGSHSVDLVRWLFADKVKKVYGVARSKVLAGMGIPTPDFYEMILEFQDGGVGVVENCWILPKSSPSLIDFKCEVVGTEGAIYLDGSHHRAMQKYTAEDSKYPDVLVRPNIYGKPMGFAVESIRYFIDCLVSGQTPRTGARDGLEVTRIICGINESVETGNPVYLS